MMSYHEKRPHRFKRLLLALLLGPLGGCHVGAPIHVWSPPQLESTVGQRVAISEIAGDDSIADKIQQQLIESAPRDAGRDLVLVDASQLEPGSPIQLVSASDEATNDIAVSSAARRQGYHYTLRGEVLHHGKPGRSGSDRLTVSWRLMALDPNDVSLGTTSGDARHIGGMPVVVDLDSAIQKYPDLALLSDRESILAAAAARETHRLFAPSVERDRVQLAIPYLTPGADDVRRGNALAMAGRWGEAEAVWREVSGSHPTSVSARHNLAIAAVAAQDFSSAKQQIRDVIRQRPTEFHKSALAWIELRQRDYHQAFGLPDPPEGWFVTHAPATTLHASPEPLLRPVPTRPLSSR